MNFENDLVRERRCVVEFGAPHFSDFWPDRIEPALRWLYLVSAVERLARWFWLGLADLARPRLDRVIEWMERQDGPPFDAGPDPVEANRCYWQTGSVWWQVLGICKWLAHDEGAEPEFARAISFLWEFHHAVEQGPDWLRDSRQSSMSETLAVALAAQRADLGAHLYWAIDQWKPGLEKMPGVDFGRWACVELANGGKRDADYVYYGITVVLMNARKERNRSKPSLERLVWLKAIWFDSGMASTASEAIAREYDVIGDRRRPGFLPARDTFL